MNFDPKPNPRQQRTIDAITKAVRAQPGEFTLSSSDVLGHLDLTIQSPNQPLRITLFNGGRISEIAFFDALEENCEADGTITEGRWIDVEEDSAVGAALRAAAEALPQPAPAPADPAAAFKATLTRLAAELLNFRDGVSTKNYPVTAEAAYEHAARLVAQARDGLPDGPGPGAGSPDAEEDPDALGTPTGALYAPADLRDMIGLPQLPAATVDEAMIESLARDFYLRHPERDRVGRAIAWTWASDEARTGNRINARRLLTAVTNGEDPHGVPFQSRIVALADVRAAEAAVEAQAEAA